MNNTQKNYAILVGGIFVIALAAGLMVKLQSVEDALYTAHLVSFSFIFFIWFAVKKMEQKVDERERAGLRGKWKAEDFDELEERIRKLEEKE